VLATLPSVRIAVARGANLNPWELANYAFDGHEVVAFGTQAGNFSAHGVPIPVRRLRSPADALAKLPSIAQAVAVRFGGDAGYLLGLQDALAGFDVAHTAELASPYSLQALKARDKGAVRRAVATVWENIAMPPAPNAIVARRAAAVAAGMDRYLAITDRARRHLLYAGVPDDRIEVIPMGVDLDRFRPTPRDRAAGEDLRILSVSRLVPEKGVEDLVVALHLLDRQGIGARLTLAGAGPDRGHLEEMARALGVAERITFAGVLPYERLPELHAQADVFVLASGPRTTWQEQFGFAIVEAMACGLPVLAGDSGSLDEVVGDPAQLVVPHYPERLAAALAALASDPARRARLGAENRAGAERRYDRRAIAKRILAFYEAALADAPRAASPSSSAAYRAPIARQS
jgi:phosphatidylinositol alpha-1,6-mannosyltransferase